MIPVSFLLLLRLDQLAITIKKRSPEYDSLEGNILGNCIMTTLMQSDVEFLAPVRIGKLRNFLRNRDLESAVSDT